jgi:hypothetical protein
MKVKLSGAETGAADVGHVCAGKVLAHEEWEARRARHEERLRPLVGAHVERQSRQQKHPIYDFIFEYYGFRPSWLMRWSPGLGVVLGGAAARDFLKHRAYHEVEGGVTLNPAELSQTRAPAARWILDLLKQTAARPPRFGCYGLHEWAMVYRIPEARHRQLALRLPSDELAAFVESQRIVCSHYDAFRFFTPEARPLNTLQPERVNRLELEQRGCLHANMDLYKWALKFYPWLGSDLVADAFLLAVELREVDMQASPYDVRALGFEPIPIETEEGRAIYGRRQQELADKAQPIRLRLMEAYQNLLHHYLT